MYGINLKKVALWLWERPPVGDDDNEIFMQFI